MFHADAYYHHNLFSSALPVRSVQDHIPSCGTHGVACMTCDVKRKAYAVCNMQAQTEELMYGTLIKSTILFCIGFWVIHTRTDAHTHQARPPARTHARMHARTHTQMLPLARLPACTPKAHVLRPDRFGYGQKYRATNCSPVSTPLGTCSCA